MEDTEKLVQAEEGTRDVTIKAKGDLGLDPGPQPPAPVFIVKGHFWDNWWNLKEGIDKIGPTVLSMLNADFDNCTVVI